MKRTASVVVALAASLFIYVVYRSEKTVVNELITLLLSAGTFQSLRSSIIDVLPLNDPIVFSLPGGLWVFCATVLSEGFYMKIKEHKIQLAMLPIVFAIGLELCQLIHLTNGRFDVWDLANYLLFSWLAWSGFRSSIPQQNILSPFTLHGFMCVACFLSVYLAHVSQ